jgi:NADH-quinone oxidoreductase subunit M
MASLGLPGLAGFWGEFPAILASYNPAGPLNEAVFRTYMVVAALGTVLAAGYLLWMLQKTAFGTVKDEFVDDPQIHDATLIEYLAWAPLLALILVLGVYPNLLFDLTDPAVVNSLSTCLTETAEAAEACFDAGAGISQAAGN